MEFLPQLQDMIEFAKSRHNRIVFPEGEDDRVIEAAKILQEEKIVFPVLLGEEGTIISKAEKIGLDVSRVELINPKNSVFLSEFSQEYAKLRGGGEGKKQVNERAASRIMSDNLYFGAMMLRKDMVAGFVGGAVYNSADVVKAAVYIIGTKAPGVKISSFFYMVFPDKRYGEEGAFLFADCAVNPEPDSSLLAEIAISTANSALIYLCWKPRVAMLSFSTKGSAKYPTVDKVIEATKIVKEKCPNLQVDGEFQVDAAIVPEVGMRKAPNSVIAGNANILIFPDLNSGNIAYKLSERLANGKAIGPIFQGIAKPFNDLSRGCSAEDIVYSAIFASFQSQFNPK